MSRPSRSPAAGLLLALLWLFGLVLPRAGRAETLLLTGGTLHPMTGPTLTNASMLVRDGKIVTVGDLTAQGEPSLDLKGQHVFPGMIAPLTVLGLQEIDAIRATRDTTESGDYGPEVETWVAVNPDSELIPVARANGYSHAQAVPLGGVVSGHSSVITLSGWTVEQLAFRRRAGLHINWPSFELDLTARDHATSPDKWKSPEDQAKEREKRLREIDRFFDDAEAYLKARNAAKTPASFPVVPAWEAMIPAIRGEIPVFLHADEVRQIRSAVAWAVRRKYRPVVAGGSEAWRVAELLATNHIPVVFTHVFTEPIRDDDRYDAQFTAPAVLTRAGVTVAFAEGTGQFGASNVRNIPYAAAQAVAFGLPREEAWRGLTFYPAQILGVQDRLGSLEPGKDATFFVADGDILDLRTQVKRLWIAGREVSLESRHTRLYDRYRQRPAP